MREPGANHRQSPCVGGERRDDNKCRKWRRSPINFQQALKRNGRRGRPDSRSICNLVLSLNPDTLCRPVLIYFFPIQSAGTFTLEKYIPQMLLSFSSFHVIYPVLLSTQCPEGQLNIYPTKTLRGPWFKDVCKIIGMPRNCIVDNHHS